MLMHAQRSAVLAQIERVEVVAFGGEALRELIVRRRCNCQSLAQAFVEMRFERRNSNPSIPRPVHLIAGKATADDRTRERQTGAPGRSESGGGVRQGGFHVAARS